MNPGDSQLAQAVIWPHASGPRAFAWNSVLIPASTGIVVPELLDGTGHIAWFKAGETIFEPSGINYLGIPGLINAHNIIATLIVQARTAVARTPGSLARTTSYVANRQ